MTLDVEVAAPSAGGESAQPAEFSVRTRGAGAVGRLAEAAALAIAPVAVFLGFHVRPMAASTMIDPWLITAYAQNGRDLMNRFGPTGFAADYEWVRLGFIAPAHVFFRLFGPIGGFYAFRYTLALIAVVPAYLLFRRLHGFAAGWVAVLLVLTCPVILTAWGSDYPDSSAVSYLLAGTACLVMPAAPARRLYWVLAAGVAFSLAFHSQAVAALAGGSTVLAYLMVFSRRSIASSIADVLVLATAAVSVTAALMVYSHWYYGRWNIFAPTLGAFLRYRQPSEIVIFHSSTWKWLLYDVYLLVPPVVVLAWLAVSMRVRDRLPRQEVAVVLALSLTVVVHAAFQFIARNWTLEYYLYTSMLFAGGSLVFTALLVRISEPLLRLRYWELVPAAMLIGVPILLRPLRLDFQFQLPTAALIGAVVVGGAVLIGLRLPATAKPPTLAVAVAVVVMGVTLMTTGLPLNRPRFPGQTLYVTPDYGSVLFTDGGTVVDEYIVASDLKTVLPSRFSEPGDIVMWWPAVREPVVDRTAAQYLWYDDALQSTLPQLDDSQSRYLAAKAPRWLALLSDDGREFDAAMAQLRAHGFTATTWREQSLASGSVHVSVRVVELAAFPHAN